MMSDAGENDLQLQMVDVEDSPTAAAAASASAAATSPFASAPSNGNSNNDDEEDVDYDHDQLPNVEEYKTQIGYKKPGSFMKSLKKPDPAGVNFNNFDGRRYSRNSNGNGNGNYGRNSRKGNPKREEMDPLQSNFDNPFVIDDDDDDDDSNNIHYNNPRPMESMELETTYASSKDPRSINAKLCFGLFATLCVIAIVLSWTVPDHFDKDGKYPWINKSSKRFLALEIFLIESGISAESDLANATSPQFFAAQWMAHGDGLSLPIPAIRRNQNDENDSASSSNDSTKDSIDHITFVERYAMATLYFATDGDNWSNDLNFLSPTHICTWYQDFEVIRDDYNLFDSDFISMGVHGCRWDETTNDLLPYSLSIPNNNLAGTIPNEIKELDRMEVLVLQFNENLSGPLPIGLSEMVSLHHLALQWCDITGTLPAWFGVMTRLDYLGLGNNDLTGTVPTQISSLTKLEVLGLDDNDLSGKLDLFGTMSNLKSLYLEDNDFFGTISSDLMSSWPVLQELDVSDNLLSGSLPTNFFNLPNSQTLEVIDLHGNQFTGPLPSYISSYDPDNDDVDGDKVIENRQNTMLKFLALQQNKFTDQIPESVVNLHVLQHLDISNNEFVGTLPEKFGELSTTLEYFYTGNNLFDVSTVPIFLIELTNLRELSIKKNNLIGTLPAFIHYWSKLEFFDVHYNKLTGTVPSKLGLLTNLKHILLKNNQFDGTLPTELSNLTKLQVLLIEQNQITGDTSPICENVISVANDMSNGDSNGNGTSTINNGGNDNIPLEYFAADCMSFSSSCPCCTTCCDSVDATCNGGDWDASLDPIWEYGYRRFRYRYDLGSSSVTIEP